MNRHNLSLNIDIVRMKFRQRVRASRDNTPLVKEKRKKKTQKYLKQKDFPRFSTNRAYRLNNFRCPSLFHSFSFVREASS